MATQSKTKVQTPANAVPASWGSEEAIVLDGQDLIEKDELKGKPFLITAIRWHVGTEGPNGEPGVLYAQFEATFSEDVENGDRFMFQDAGKGIRKQVTDYFAAVGVSPDLVEEWHDCRIVCPRGIRISDHTQEDERGRKVPVRSYYLTTSGRRSQ